MLDGEASMDLIIWNQQVEAEGARGIQEEYEEILDKYLWESDPNEKYHPDVQFNLNHLLGMLVCRGCVGGPSEELEQQRLKLTDTLPSDMSLKEIKDTLANLQFEWPVFVNKISGNAKGINKIDGLLAYLQGLISRIGVFLSYAQKDSVLNDVQDVCACDHGLVRLTSSGIRRLLASVFILYRHIDLFFMAEVVDKCSDGFKVGVSAYHHEASTESFHKMCMHFYLPAAAKMHYKHDFPGMYNDVSQAVYFHDSGFKRIKREEYTSTNPIHMLPSVCLLYPEVPVKFEDDHFNPNVDQGWYWVLVPRRIYLVSPEPKVYYSEDLSALVELYLSTRVE